MVYCGLYPVDNARYDDLKEALAKLKLNDAALQYEPETSQALGFGFRCGFLGLLHMDVIEERLEREYNLNLIATSPSVIYHVYKTDGTMISVDNPAALPAPQNIDRIEEPYVKAQIMVPKEYVGAIMDLCQKKRGEYVDMQVLDELRMELTYEIPLSEIIYDFFDKMKSSTKGYASIDYAFSQYRPSKLVKMDILLNGQIVDALSTIVFKDFAYHRGNAMTVKLKDLIPKQQFEIPVQAAIGGKIIARTNIKALRKNVLAKCYGGDIRERKTAGKAKRRKETHEDGRLRGNSARGVHGGFVDGRRRMTPASWYIHVPFCASVCPYCDFFRTVPSAPESSNGWTLSGRKFEAGWSRIRKSTPFTLGAARLPCFPTASFFVWLKICFRICTRKAK